jgi:hypothetical protein
MAVFINSFLGKKRKLGYFRDKIRKYCITNKTYRYEKDSPDAGNSRHVDSLLYDKEG